MTKGEKKELEWYKEELARKDREMKDLLDWIKKQGINMKGYAEYQLTKAIFG